MKRLLLLAFALCFAFAASAKKFTLDVEDALLGFVRNRPCEVEAFEIEEEDEEYHVWAEGLPEGLSVYCHYDWYDEGDEYGWYEVVDTEVWICGETNAPAGTYNVTFYADVNGRATRLLTKKYVLKNPPRVTGKYEASSDTLPVGYYNDDTGKDVQLKNETASGRIAASFSLDEEGYSQCDAFSYQTSYESTKYESWFRQGDVLVDQSWFVVTEGIAVGFQSDDPYEGCYFTEVYGTVVLNNDSPIEATIGYYQVPYSGCEIYIWETDAESFGASMPVVEDFGINYTVSSGKVTIVGRSEYVCRGDDLDGGPYNKPQKGCEHCNGKGNSCQWLIPAVEPGSHAIDEYGVLRIPAKINGLPVTAIGDDAFLHDSHLFLEKIIIPESVTSIGASAFDGQTIEVAEKNPSFCVKDGYLLNKKGTQLIAASSPILSERVPEGVVEIMPWAFSGCDESYYSVRLPKSLKKIGDGAFDSSLLESIRIPEGVASIGKYAFGYCSALRRIEIPSTVKKIEEHAFDWCTFGSYGFDEGLEEVVLHEGVTTIGTWAFHYALSKGATVRIPASVTKIEFFAFVGSGGGKFYFAGKPPKTVSNDAFIIQDEELGYEYDEGAYEGYGYYPIQYAAEWNKVINDAGVWRGLLMRPDMSAYTDEPWYYPDADYVYEAGILYRDGDLVAVLDPTVKSITIPADWEYVGDGLYSILRGCPNLEAINVAKGNPYFKSIGGVLYRVERRDENGDGRVEVFLELVAVPPAVKTVTIPKNCMSELSYYTFRNCKQLTAINVEAGNPYYKSIDGILYRVERWDESDGRDEVFLELVAVPPAIKTVTIPKNCTWGELSYKFRHCTQLTAINVEAGNPYYKSIDGVLYATEGGSLYLSAVPPAIKTITIPKRCSMDSWDLSEQLRYFNCPQLTAINVEEGANRDYKSIGGVLYRVELRDENSDGKDEEYLQLMFVPQAIKKVTIPQNCDSVYSDYGDGLDNCTQLTAIDVEAGNPYFKSIGGVLYYVECWDEDCDGEDEEYLYLTAVPATLKIVTLPKNCRSGEGLTFAFKPCAQLTTINVEAGNPYLKSLDGVLCSRWDEYGPYGRLEAIPAKKGRVIIPEDVTDIDYHAYQSEAPLTMTFMGYPGSFWGFDDDWRYDEWTGEEWHLNFDIKLQYVEAYAEEWESSLDEDGKYCGFPVSMTTVDLWTYKTAKDKVTLTGRTIYNTAMDLEIPETINGVPVKEIAANAFKDDLSLTSVIIPDGVTTIGANAFAGCENLLIDQVYFPSTVKSVGKGAFVGCQPNWEEAIIPGEIAEIYIDDGDKLATAATGVKLNATTGILTATFTKPGNYDSVLFGDGRLTLLRYIATEIPTISVAVVGGDDKCTVKGAGAYLIGKTFTLTASVPKYARFLGWFDSDGELRCKSPNYVDTMTKDMVDLYSSEMTFTAEFEVEEIYANLAWLPNQINVGDRIDESFYFDAPSGIKSVKVANLPTGLKAGKLDNYGSLLITGMPTKVGAYKTTVTVTAKSGVVKTFSYPIEVDAEMATLDVPSPEMLSAADFYVGGAIDSFYLGVYASSSVKSITAKGLPAGLKLVKNAYDEWEIIGKPTKAGTYKVALTMTTNAGTKVNSEMELTIGVLPKWCLGYYTLDLEGEDEDLGNGWVYFDGIIVVNPDGKLQGYLEEVDKPRSDISTAEINSVAKVIACPYAKSGGCDHVTQEKVHLQVPATWYYNGKLDAKIVTTITLTRDGNSAVMTYQDDSYEDGYLYGESWEHQPSTFLDYYFVGTYYGEVENGYYDEDWWWETVPGIAEVTIDEDCSVTGRIVFDDGAFAKFTGTDVILPGPGCVFQVKVNATYYNEVGKQDGKSTFFLKVSGDWMGFYDGDEEDYVTGELWWEGY